MTRLYHLPRHTPESQGVTSHAILQFIDRVQKEVHELHSVMLLRHGYVIAEGWWSPYQSHDPHMLFSLSKSFTSTAIGFAVMEGLLTLEDRVIGFFPDERPTVITDHLGAMCVRDLLIMASGHAADPWDEMVASAHWVQGFFNAPLHDAPGSHFVYNTSATYLLAAILQKVAKMKLVDYLESRLFAPLGIHPVRWDESPQGVNQGGVGLWLKTEDIARFGQLYLQKGMWNGQQLLPILWVQEATSSQISNGNDPTSDWTQGYGYQFWRGRHATYSGNGVFGQFCIVMPDQDAVLVMTGGVDVFEMQHPLNLVWSHLLPAMSPLPLPEDTTAHTALTNRLATLHHPTVQGSLHSSLSEGITNKIYEVSPNPLQISTLCFAFSPEGVLITVVTPLYGEEHIHCGGGEWQASHVGFLNNRWLQGKHSVLASGAWTSEDTFTMIVRLNETPFYYTCICYFSDDGNMFDVMIEIKINASIDSSLPVMLTGTHHANSTI